MFPAISIALAFASSTVATHLFVSSYSGFVRTLSLEKQYNGAYNLTPIATAHGCGTSPSWLTVSHAQKAVFCVNEGLTTKNGSISSYWRNSAGALNLISKQKTIGGPVYSTLFGSNPDIYRAIALPHYAAGALSTFSVTDRSEFVPLDTFTFKLAQPGPVPDRQDAPHPHETILDPTGRFILVPDLGADLIRIFRINPVNNRLTSLEPFAVAPGSGPRHGAFWSPAGPRAHKPLYLFVVTELANTLTTYSVTYSSYGDLTLQEVFATNTFGGGEIPAGAAAAEIAVTPDSRFIIVSNRNDSSFSIPRFPPGSTGERKSDSLATFALNDDGSLTFQQLSPAGGSFPRQFSINKAGDLVAVGLQLSHRVVIIARDVTTGVLGDFVASHHVKGQLTNVAWDKKFGK